MKASEHLREAERIVLIALNDQDNRAHWDGLESAKVNIWKALDSLPEEL
jgi:hypothetical protein